MSVVTISAYIQICTSTSWNDRKIFCWVNFIASYTCHNVLQTKSTESCWSKLIFANKRNSVSIISFNVESLLLLGSFKWFTTVMDHHCQNINSPLRDRSKPKGLILYADFICCVNNVFELKTVVHNLEGNVLITKLSPKSRLESILISIFPVSEIR